MCVAYGVMLVISGKHHAYILNDTQNGKKWRSEPTSIWKLFGPNSSCVLIVLEQLFFLIYSIKHIINLIINLTCIYNTEIERKQSDYFWVLFTVGELLFLA